MPSYKLTYFPARGRAEIIRMVLAAGNVEYEDVRIAKEEWAELKDQTPEGKLPIFKTDDGVVLSQSQAIAAYAAELGGLHGETPIEKAKAHMIVSMVTEMHETILSSRIEKNEEKQKEIKEKIYPTFLANAEKLLVANGGKFFVGSKLTYADVAFFNLDDNLGLTGIKPDAGGKTPPHLSDLLEKVKELPTVKAWLAKRPESQF